MRVLADPSALDWPAFLGQLHPVLLHLPIGLLAAVLLVECLGVLRTARNTVLRRSLLWCTVLASVAAGASGWCLGGTGGYSGEVVSLHKSAGIAVTILLFVLATMDAIWGNARHRRLFATARFVGLLIALALMIVTGHLGGSLTHGRGFLERHAPEWFADAVRDLDAALLGEQRRYVGTAGDPVNAGDNAVLSVLEQHCIECHGPDKQKGKLRLDTPAGLRSVAEPGDVLGSELARRILLPRQHEDAMPPEPGRLDDSEVTTLLAWIRNGAGTEALAAAHEAASLRSAKQAALIARAEAATGAKLRPIPASGDALRADFARGSTPIRALQTLREFAPRLAELSFAGRQFEMAVLDELPRLEAVRRLHLERSEIDDAGLAQLLTKTPNVEYLNLHSTGVSDASIPAIEQLTQLRRLVLFETSIADATRLAFAAAHTEIEVTGLLELPLPLEPERLMRRILAADASQHRIALLRERAIDVYDVIWERTIEQLHDLHVLPTGNVLFQETWTRLLEVDPETDEVVWSYDAATQNRGKQDGPVEVHSFGRLPNGSTYIAESGPARIIEVDANGAITHAIPLRVDRPHHHHDTRLVRPTPANTYLVAHERDGCVREYARDGSIVWTYSVPLFDREPRPGHGADAWGNQVFAAWRLNNGNTLVTTGNGHRILEVAPDGGIVWEFTPNDIPGISIAWVTTVQVLRSGNLIIGNCHAGTAEPQMFEITRDKEIAWTFRDFHRFGNALSNSVIIEDERD